MTTWRIAAAVGASGQIARLLGSSRVGEMWWIPLYG
jgi:hypothetical protein